MVAERPAQPGIASAEANSLRRAAYPTREFRGHRVLFANPLPTPCQPFVTPFTSAAHPALGCTPARACATLGISLLLSQGKGICRRDWESPQLRLRHGGLSNKHQLPRRGVINVLRVGRRIIITLWPSGAEEGEPPCAATCGSHNFVLRPVPPWALTARRSLGCVCLSVYSAGPPLVCGAAVVLSALPNCWELRRQ